MFSMCEPPWWRATAGRPPPGTVAVVLGVRVDGERLRAVLTDAAGTIRAAAERVEINENRLHDWMSGRNAPEPQTLYRILRTLRRDIIDVLPSGTPITLEVLRWRVGKTAQQVAAEAGISRPRYGDIESGVLTPTGRDLRRLAAVYGVTEDEVRAAAQQHAEVAWIVHVPTALAERVKQARHGRETVADTILRLIDAGLSLDSPPAE